MATYQSSPFGILNGEVTEQIAYVWKGVKCLRRRPAGYNDANTLQQQINRKKFVELSALSRIFKRASRVGFKKVATGKTEHNVFVEVNQDAVMVDPAFNVTINPAQIVVSKGILPTTDGTLAATRTGTLLTLNWTTNIEAEYQNDMPKVYARIAEIAGLVELVAAVTRQTEIVNITLPIASASPIDLYVFFKSAVDNEVSDSEYIQVP